MRLLGASRPRKRLLARQPRIVRFIARNCEFLSRAKLVAIIRNPCYTCSHSPDRSRWMLVSWIRSSLDYALSSARRGEPHLILRARRSLASRRMLQRAAPEQRTGCVLRGRFAAPQDEAVIRRTSEIRTLERPAFGLNWSGRPDWGDSCSAPAGAGRRWEASWLCSQIALETERATVESGFSCR